MAALRAYETYEPLRIVPKRDYAAIQERLQQIAHAQPAPVHAENVLLFALPTDAVAEHALSRKVAALKLGDALAHGDLTLACVQTTELETYYLLFRRRKLIGKAHVNGSGTLAPARQCRRVAATLAAYCFPADTRVIEGGAYWLAGCRWWQYRDDVMRLDAV